MRKRFVFLLAATVCLALAFTPLMADRDRDADRTRTSNRGVQSADDSGLAPNDINPIGNRPFKEVTNLSTSGRAEALLGAAARAGNPGDAIASLHQALELGLNSDKALAEAYTMLGDLYEGAASKQLHMYGMAMQYSGDPGSRAYLQRRIDDLGGDVFTFAMGGNSNSTASTKTIGYADSCDAAVPLALPAYVSGLNIENYLGTDHDWFSFDVPGPDGWAVRIETISDLPGSWTDDTDLTLYSGCVGGLPEGFLAFDDDGSEQFMSLIETDCLVPGTYYIEVGGFFDILSPDNFDLDVQVTDVCLLPAPDAYEPDDAKELAPDIGHPTSIPMHANGWGRAKSEIQDHSIFPAGDVDYMHFALTRSELVRMTTAIQFPTKFNGFESIPGGTEIDTFVGALYGDEPDYGGFCNDLATGFSPYCRSHADCPDPIAPHPAFPPNFCIPVRFFTFGGIPRFFVENPVAWNEDISPGNWASELLVCLPRADQQTPSLTASGDWYFRVMSSPTYAPTAVFLYQAQVKNEVECNFELEPNNTFSAANPMVLGETYHGIEEKSVFWNQDGLAGYFARDPDLYSFDVDETSVVIFATDNYDLYWADSFLEIYVGPDDDGFYYFTGLDDDDSGPGYQAWLGAILPPANVLLGNLVADADYILNHTAALNPQPNFAYNLLTSISAAPLAEVEPNDTCATGNALGGNRTVDAAIDPACDQDTFNFSLTQNAYVVIETSADLGDTTMALEKGDGTWLGCDDDSGEGLRSRIEACLPAGDYCARVRAFSGFDTMEFEFSYTATPGCMPLDPPAVTADGLYRCDGVGFASPQEEFETCPN